MTTQDTKHLWIGSEDSEKEVVEEMLGNIHSRHWEMCFEYVKRVVTMTWSKREQESVVHDITCSTIQKLYEYARRSGEKGISLISIKGLAMMIARNQLHDHLRKEYSWRGRSSLEGLLVNEPYEEDTILPIEELEKALSQKEHLAFLIDLAWCIKKQEGFDSQTISLQQAFVVYCIWWSRFVSQHLQHQVMIHYSRDGYQRQYQRGLDQVDSEQYWSRLPVDLVGCSRHASLVSLAYKRVAQLADTQERNAFYGFCGRLTW